MSAMTIVKHTGKTEGVALRLQANRRTILTLAPSPEGGLTVQLHTERGPEHRSYIRLSSEESEQLLAACGAMLDGE